MGTPIIRGFKPTDPILVRLFYKAKLQRTLTGEISEEVAKEIDACFGSCDECAHQVHRTMYHDKDITVCSLVGIKKHLILQLIVKIADAEGNNGRIREIGCCSGYLKKPT